MKTPNDTYAIRLDGREVDRIVSWDTAVSRAVSILSGGEGRVVEVVNTADGQVEWSWNRAWDNPHEAVQFVPGVGFVSEPAQWDGGQNRFDIDAVWLVLAVSLAANVALLWGIYYLLF